MEKICLLSSKKYGYFKKSLLSLNKNFQDIDIKTETFPDGEHHFIIDTPGKLKGKPAVYVCGTTDDEAIFELYNIASTLVREQCSSLHLVVPYFGYSTMERATVDGEVVTAKNIARMLSSIPLSPQGNFIYMVDLHSFGTQYYFEKSLHPVHLSAWKVIQKMVTDCGQNIVLATADMGRAKWVEKMGDALKCQTAFIMKRRLDGKNTVVEALNADVKGKNVVIFDDMIRSGSSVIKAAEAYKAKGAKDIFVAVVHGVFTPSCVEKMKDCGYFKKILVTNSHPNALKYESDFIKVYDIASVIDEGLVL